MCIIRLNNWYGRYGNNIIQIAAILRRAVKANAHYLTVPEGRPIKSTQLEGGCKCLKSITVSAELEPIDMESWLCLQKYYGKDVKKRDPDDLLIHVRSGDTFFKNPHPNYYPPGLEYYKWVIGQENWKTVTFLLEDSAHPLENEFLSLGVVKKLGFAESLNEIMAHDALCISMGTFPFAGYLLSKKPAKRVYVTSDGEFWKYWFHPSTEVKIWEMPEHGPWINSESQRAELIGAPLSYACQLRASHHPDEP